MADVGALEELACWFVVLPDCPAAAPVAAAGREHATQELVHASGRPWIVGRCAPVTVGAAEEARVALVGQHALDTGALASAARRMRDVVDVDGFARSLVGSSHVLASVAGHVRAQGTVTGLRRLFYGSVGDVTVAADRADVLAVLRDAAIDEQRLAVHLLDASTIYALADLPVWRGVRALPTDHYLVLERSGGQRCTRWWAAPRPDVSMAEGAAALREALSAAVQARVAGRELVSCDLGGLDSTSVCSLAARLRANVVAYTAEGRDPAGEDTAWARRTVDALGNVEHHVIGADLFPSVYEGLCDADDQIDEPSALAAFRSRSLFIPLQAAARGSRLHLTGFGGDELLAGSPAHLHALLRTHPRLALRHARGFAIQRKWSYRETVRQLAGNRSYREWLARRPEQLAAPPPSPDTPTLDWGSSPRMPPWATPDAVAAVRELVRAAARTAEPLAERRGQHVELEGMRATSRVVRSLGQMTAASGLELAAPYYDDAVIAAGLAVRPEERVTPWRYKPLIVEAMRGVVPDTSLSRYTKDEGSHDVGAGLREHRGELLALIEDSRLARLGLIDADALCAVCSRPLSPSMSFTAVFQTVACEVWLRSRDRAAVAI